MSDSFGQVYGHFTHFTLQSRKTGRVAVNIAHGERPREEETPVEHLQEEATAPEALRLALEPTGESMDAALPEETTPRESELRELQDDAFNVVVFETTTEPLEELERPFHKDLLEKLNHRSASMRETAVKVALSLPPEQVLELVRQEAEYHRKQYQGILWLTLAGYIMLCLISAFCFSELAMVLGAIAIGCAVLPVVLSLIDLMSKRPTRAIYSLSRVIGEQKDGRVLAQALLLAQETTDPILRYHIHDMLRVALPKLRYDQSTHWTKEQKAALLLPLQNPHENMLLVEAVLAALQQVGDESAIPLVQRLATYPLYGSRSIEIQKAASDCLPFLYQRAHDHRQSRQLLRASGATEGTDPAHLLRPAAPGASDPPEQLLRPGGN
jgi:hypothetical protein